MTAASLRRWAMVVAANLGLVLVMAGAAELMFGGWLSRDPLDRLALQRDVAFGVDARPLYPGGQMFTYRRDHWGFRGAGTDPARVSIVTIGGSTTNQLYLTDDATWQTAMAGAFAQAGHAMTVANAGIDGQSTIGHLVALDSWLARVPGLRPRLVVAYVGVNDVHVGGNVVDEMRHSSRFKWFTQNSALYRLWQSVTGAIKARKARLNHEAVDFAKAQWTTRPQVPDEGRDPGPYARRLRLLAERIRAMGAEPVFVTQPRGDWRVADGQGAGRGLATPAGAPNGVDQHRWLAAFNAATLQVCQDLALVCVDVAGTVTFGDGDFYDAVHNTPQGARKIGQALYEGLKTHPGLDKRG